MGKPAKNIADPRRTSPWSPPANSSVAVLCVAGAEVQYLVLPIIYCTTMYHAHCNDLLSRGPQAMLWICSHKASPTSSHLPFEDGLCKATNALFLANTCSCTLLLVCMCLERYLAMLHAAHLPAAQRLLGRVALSLAIWPLIGVRLLTVFSSGSVTNRFPDACTDGMENFPARVWSRQLAATALASAALGFFLFLIILACYMAIVWRILNLSDSSARAWALKQRSLCSILLVPGLLALCFLPFHLVHALHTLGRSTSSQRPGSRAPALHRHRSACGHGPLQPQLLPQPAALGLQHGECPVAAALPEQSLHGPWGWAAARQGMRCSSPDREVPSWVWPAEGSGAAERLNSFPENHLA
ncbi:unnamed protein product [Eretmochelys imbricata]